MSTDLFEIQSTKDLFNEIQLAVVEYHKVPTGRLLLFLVFSLNHLREWIAESSHEEICTKIKSKKNLTTGEHFFREIWKLEEFKIVNELCNRSKHYNIKKNIATTSVTKGFTAGSRAGDSLDQVYYSINGIDSRTIFASLIREYNVWFCNHAYPSRSC